VTRSEALTLSAQGKRYSRKRKNIKSADKVFRKQTLESLDPLLQLNWRRAIFISYLISLPTLKGHDKSNDQDTDLRHHAG